MKHYVIATEQAYAAKKLHQVAEIASAHTDYSTARSNADKLNRQAGFGRRAFAPIESEEPLLKGQCYPEVLERHLADQYERRAVGTMKSVLDPTWRGGTPVSDDEIAYGLQDLGLSLEQLTEKYEDQARAELNEAVTNRLELAQQAAERSAVKSKLTSDRQEITYSFPAVRGMQAGRAYYVAQIPYSALVRLFVFDEDEVVPAQHRAQRVLNEKRAQDIADYVVNNPNEYVLPALTASVSAEMHFEAIAVSGAADRVGLLHIPCDAVMLINDGQHRRKGIEHALKVMPALREETVAVTIFYDQGLERSQQMFADINGKQVKPSSAINALYDRRNPFNAWTLAILERLPKIARRVDMENASVGAKSYKLWSLIAFKKFLSLLTGVTEKNIGELDATQLAKSEAFVVRFFDECGAVVPQWSAMIEARMSAHDVRENLVIGHAVWLEALGMFGRRALYHGCRVPVTGDVVDPDHANWERMAALADVVPAKDADMWSGRCVVLGKMQKTADGVKSTAAQMLQLANVPLGPDMEAIERRLRAA